MTKEIVQFCKLMESGLQLRLTTEETLEMVAKSAIHFEYKDFAEIALLNSKEKAYKLSRSMKDFPRLFPKEFTFAVEKTENYFCLEFSKTFNVFVDYFKELDELQNNVTIPRSA